MAVGGTVVAVGAAAVALGAAVVAVGGTEVLGAMAPVVGAGGRGRGRGVPASAGGDHDAESYQGRQGGEDLGDFHHDSFSRYQAPWIGVAMALRPLPPSGAGTSVLVVKRILGRVGGFVNGRTRG